MPRQSWTDERLDHFEKRVDERFDNFEERVDERFMRVETEMKLRFEQVDERLDRIDDEVKGIRIALRDLHEDNKATNRVMTQGFIALSGAIVTGCVLVAGAAAF